MVDISAETFAKNCIHTVTTKKRQKISVMDKNEIHRRIIRC